MAESLADILNGYSASTLTAIISYCSLRSPSNKKADHVRTLSAAFSDPARIQAVYAGLQGAGREVVHILLRQDGISGVVSLRQQLLAKKLIEPISNSARQIMPRPPDYRATTSRQLQDVLAHLLARGLVFSSRPRTSGQEPALDFYLAQQYFIPEEIRKHLPPPPSEPEWLFPLKSAPAEVTEGSARVFQRDLYLYWSYIRRNAVELTAKNQVAKRHLVALNDALLVKETIRTGQVEGDFPRLVFLRAILEQLGLLSVENSALRAGKSTDFFTLDPLQRIKQCFEAYLVSRQMNELAWQNKIQVAFNTIPLIPAPQMLLDARKLVLSYLKLAAEWLAVSLVIQRIRTVQYEFLFQRREFMPQNYFYHQTMVYFTDGNSYGWGFPTITDDAAGWEEVEARLIHGLISGPFFWMGLVDLGMFQETAAQGPAFRLSQIGKWLTGLAQAPVIPREGGQVVAQPDFTITAFDPVSDATLMVLDQMAERLTAERAVVLRLTQQSVYAAQQNGWDAGSIQTFLEGLTGQPLPANVARTLQDWQSRHERIRVFPSIAILHAASPDDLADLRRDKDLAAWLRNSPAPGLAALPAGRKVETLVGLLKERSWLPLVTHKAAALPEGAVRMDAEGRLSFTVQTPDLYLRGYLARFADQDAPDTYRLTHASIRRAIRGGLTAPDVSSELERVLGGGVSPEWEKRILAWAGHFGQAAMEESVLLMLKDEQTLQDLLKDPELGELLHPFKPGELRVTARVRPADVERVRALLEERGVEVKARGNAKK
jgi:hypothetical protein